VKILRDKKSYYTCLNYSILTTIQQESKALGKQGKMAGSLCGDPARLHALCILISKLQCWPFNILFKVLATYSEINP